MPDADHTQMPPDDWGTAFAALPIETPPAGGWQRMSRALDARMPERTRARPRWPMWLAAAAVVSAAALLPMWLREAPAPDAPMTASVATITPTIAPAAAPSDTGTDATTPAPSADASEPTRVAATVPAPRSPDADTVAKPKPTATPRKRRPPTAPQRDVEPQRMIAAASSDTTAQTTAADALAVQSLQAESAQLEAVVALARDERVASASGAALTGELDDRIGRIDASLSQPDLGDAERADLWRQRVATMRELAGVETTQRWLLTQGERYDGALVSVD